ncbi:MAG: bifunctional folylpolyglutamate synthase/dihydrofolate synthase [Arcobacter sp.]|nr:MAG: bifunctional folylpolyglutamate synthase/dihydrofolate synthase [Arcobacter sp.]
MTLHDFLNDKPLYYTEIDYTRMPRAYASIKDKLHIPPIIHLVGTNGKGSTGRFIANALVALGKNVGHYTSPHIKKFNERIWLNGENVKNAILQEAHERLQELLSDEFLKTLSYFEYTTFLAILVYKDCDYIVLEAGLGGEYDATNAFDKILSVITPIGIDHEDFLGKSIEDISLTKLRSVSSKAIMAKQGFEEVLEVAVSLAKGSDKEFISYTSYLNEKMVKMAEDISCEQEHPHYLQENLLLSMAVIKELGYEIKKNLFNSQRLEGRMQRIKANIWLDVGHNSLAAEAIAHSFAPKSVNLVYNSYKDKNYLSILSLLAPIIKQVEIIEVDDDRIVPRGDLVAAIIENGLKYKTFTKVLDDENYLVFGSFSVVEAFKALSD